MSCIFPSDLFDEEQDGTNHNANNHRLWVDLYSPKLYIDLMSDEVGYDYDEW